MIRIIKESDIPRNRRYAIDDKYEDIKPDLLVDQEIIEGLQPFMHEGYLYAPHRYSREHLYAIYSKKEIPENIDADYCNEITCPFCGFQEMDSEECPDSKDEEECLECGSIFSYERKIEVSYSSTKVKKTILPEV